MNLIQKPTEKLLNSTAEFLEGVLPNKRKKLTLNTKSYKLWRQVVDVVWNCRTAFLLPWETSGILKPISRSNLKRFHNDFFRIRRNASARLLNQRRHSPYQKNNEADRDFSLYFFSPHKMKFPNGVEAIWSFMKWWN